MKKRTFFAAIWPYEAPRHELNMTGIAFQCHRWTADIRWDAYPPCCDFRNWVARHYPCHLEIPSPLWNSTPDLSPLRRRY